MLGGFPKTENCTGVESASVQYGKCNGLYGAWVRQCEKEYDFVIGRAVCWHS